MVLMRENVPRYTADDIMVHIRAFCSLQTSKYIAVRNFVYKLEKALLRGEERIG